MVLGSGAAVVDTGADLGVAAPDGAAAARATEVAITAAVESTATARTGRHLRANRQSPPQIRAAIGL